MSKQNGRQDEYHNSEADDADKEHYGRLS